MILIGVAGLFVPRANISKTVVMKNEKSKSDFDE